MRSLLAGLMVLGFLNSHAQDWNGDPEISWTGYLDVYYAFDFDEPHTSTRQPFLYNFNRHNEFNTNLALAKVSVNHDRYRANLGFQAGNYATDVYALEEQEMKMVHEANIGIALNSSGNVWLDAGIFGSHLGFESPLAIDNPTVTRSLVAESSPYYLAGAKVTWSVSDQLDITGIWSNGWQRIRRVDGNSMPSFGTQIVFRPAEGTLINWSTFVTTEDPDDARRKMYFSNLYGMFKFTEQISAIAGFDFGMRQEFPGSNTTQSWIAPVGIVQYRFNEKYASAFRAEYYNDPEVIINGLQVLGLSANFDYYPTSNVACRIEGRHFSGREVQMFGSDDFINNFTILGSIAIKLLGAAKKAEQN